MTDDNGTHLEGIVAASENELFPAYTTRRAEVGGYRPWPEWVIPPISITETNGTVVFDCMLSWWSRYIGISPYFEKPMRLTIEDCRIKKIEGGQEADALKRFLEEMKKYLGDGVYDFTGIHTGVHPQAVVGAHHCPSLLYRRVIDHSHACNIHFHIGAPPPTKEYPYWFHCTGDIPIYRDHQLRIQSKTTVPLVSVMLIGGITHSGQGLYPPTSARRVV